jgi:ribonuclease MRP protein subunit RMP1
MDKKQILAVHSVLHLVYHRNKNQHQRAKWWKWLSLLKRTTLDLGSMDSATAASRRQHLASHLIPRCYLYVISRGLVPITSPGHAVQTRTDMRRAFSTVIADNQFATLGVVLLAALARLAKATGIDREMAVQVQPKIKKAAPVISAKEDRGERISRKESDALSGPPQAPVSKTTVKSTDDKSDAKRTKKSSKRKKNAIDDLFSGLM